MKVKSFMKVWELGKGRNQSRWMMAVVPGQSAFPLPALQDDPLTVHQPGHGLLPEVGFREIKGAVGERSGDPSARIPYPLYSLGMVSLRQGKLDEAEAYALEALGVDAKSAYALDVLGLAYANQGKMLPAFQTLGQALRLAPKEGFIRAHYLQVRALYIERARLEYNQKKEKSNEKTG